jgi:hypothetical protein
MSALGKLPKGYGPYLKGKIGSRVGCVCTKNRMTLCRAVKGARPRFIGKCGGAAPGARKRKR